MIEQALRDFWEQLSDRIERSRISGASTSSYSHFNGFHSLTQLVIELLVEQGIDRSDIHLNAPVKVPGGYRSSARTWDIVAMEAGMPLAAIEIMSLIGSSFGPNLHNRMETILGATADFNRAYGRENMRPLKPCIGLLFVAEDSERFTRQLKGRASVAFDETADSTYTHESNMGNFLASLVNDDSYTAICYVATKPPPDFLVREPYPDLGFYRFRERVKGRIAALRKAHEDSGIDSIEFGRMLGRRDDVDDVLDGIISTPEGLTATEAAIIRQRRSIVSELRALAIDPGANETKMQSAIGNRHWLFGGRYIGVAERSLIPLDQHDIPLISADGSLNIVELKGPESKLVRRHRSHLIVANEVHEAVSQCLNYLRAIDEMGASIEFLQRNERGVSYDLRRARGTILIGHADRVNLDGVTREQVEQTIRSYNAHLTRIQVITYSDFIESADRALQFDEEGAAS